MAKKTKKSQNRAIKEDFDDLPEKNKKELSQKETIKNKEKDKEGEKPGTNKISMEKKLAQMEKDRLYLHAEIETIKRQNLKERSQLIKYGAERLARDLLETLDVFKSALNSEVNHENYKDFVKGVEMTSTSLKVVLEKHGIKELDCFGKVFDPNTQEALSSEITDKYPEGYVTQVLKAPYVYQDKLLRPGQVVVSKALKPGKTDSL